MNDCQIDSYDHYLVRLNSEAVSAKVGLCVAALVVVVVVNHSNIKTITPITMQIKYQTRSSCIRYYYDIALTDFTGLF